MWLKGFRPPNLDRLYREPSSPQRRAWRRLGARDKVRNLLELVAPYRDQIASLLEVGCGTGAVLDELAHVLGTEHVGLDIGEPVRSTNAVRFARYDGVTIPFDDRAFDLVYATHVVEHVRDQRGFLLELRRVARRYVYVEVPCELHLRTTQSALQASLDIGHINAYTPESFALLLATSGLGVQRLEVFDHSYAMHRFHAPAITALAKTALRRALLRVHRGLATRVFTYHVGALCERM
jgi:SAM-dependent methyltransferase